MPSRSHPNRRRRLLLILAATVTCAYDPATPANDPLTIEIFPRELTMAAGTRQRLDALVSPAAYLQDGHSFSSDVITWTSDDPQTASVRLLGGPIFPSGTGVIVLTTGRGLEASTPVCAQRPGTAVVTASYKPRLGQLQATAVDTVVPSDTGNLQCIGI